MNTDQSRTSPFAGLLFRTAEWFALFLTAVLPWKFASMVSVPEMPASYWFDFISILFVTWPIYLFCFSSAIVLLLTVTAVFLQKGLSVESRYGSWWTAGMLLLSVLSLCGWLNASCKEYAAQMIVYTAGTGCYLTGIYLLLERREGFSRDLFRAVAVGACLSIFSGFYQYFWGFQELMDHVYNQNVQAGLQAYGDRIYSRIQEQRLQADFSVCNTYAGYLAMILPLLIAGAWTFGRDRVEPAHVSKYLLGSVAGITVLILIFLTGSRGGLLAVTAALFCFALALPLTKRQRAGFLLLGVLAVAGFFVLVVTGRGFKSMYFRFDYDYAAFRMMLEHPFAGTGWGDFFHDFQIIKLYDDAEAPQTPHNFPLLFGSQSGVLSFLTCCFLMLLPLIYAFRMSWRKGEKYTPFFYALTAAAGAALLDLQLEITYETPAFFCTFGIVAFLLFRQKTESTVPLRLPRYIFLLPLLLSLFTIGTSFRRMQCESAFAGLQETLNPRFSREAIQNPALLRAPDPAKVMPKFKEAEKYGPYNPFPWSMMCDYMISRGELFSAQHYIEGAIRRSPERAAFYLRRAQVTYLMTGDPARSAGDLEKVRSLFPKNPDYRKPDLELLKPERPGR